MSFVAVVRREGPSRLDALRSRGPIAWGLLVAIAAACFVGYAMPRLWTVHTAATSLRPSLETGIAAAAVVGVILLVARFRQTRLLRDLLLLTAFATVALSDFVFHALPAYDLRATGYGAGAGIAMTILAAGAFAAVSLAPVQQRVTGRPRRSLVLAALATVGWIALGEVVELANGLVLGRGPVRLDAPIWTVAALLCFIAAAGLRHPLRSRCRRR